MPELGASAAVISSGEILLIKREDFEVWGLPGGSVEPGESVAQAAVREVHEETGLKVKLTRLVGIYSSPQWPNGGGHNVVFAAEPESKDLKLSEVEVVEAGFFSPSQLPEPLIWWHRQRILDAANGVNGRACLQDVVLPIMEEMDRREVYAFRDRSQLSRSEFYLRHLAQVGPGGEQIEVRGVES